MTMIGHNSGNARIAIEIRLFNSLAQFGGRTGPVQQLELGAGATVGDVVRLIGLPLSEIFLVLRNGHDVSPGRYEGGNVNTEAFLDDGDVGFLSNDCNPCTSHLWRSPVNRLHTHSQHILIG